MKTDRLGLIRTNYSLQPISFMKIGQEVLSDSPTVQGIATVHSNMKTGLKIVGFGIVGMIAIHSFLK